MFGTKTEKTYSFLTKNIYSKSLFLKYLIFILPNSSGSRLLCPSLSEDGPRGRPAATSPKVRTNALPRLTARLGALCCINPAGEGCDPHRPRLPALSLGTETAGRRCPQLAPWQENVTASLGLVPLQRACSPPLPRRCSGHVAAARIRRPGQRTFVISHRGRLDGQTQGVCRRFPARGREGARDGGGARPPSRGVSPHPLPSGRLPVAQRPSEADTHRKGLRPTLMTACSSGQTLFPNTVPFRALGLRISASVSLGPGDTVRLITGTNEEVMTWSLWERNTAIVTRFSVCRLD